MQSRQAFLKNTARSLAGSITAAGSIFAPYFLAFSGSLTPQAAINRLLTRNLPAGSIAPTSGFPVWPIHCVRSWVRLPPRASLSVMASLQNLSGALAVPAASLARNTALKFAGDDRAAGFDYFRSAILAFAGAVRASGSFTRAIVANLASASLTAAGALAKQTRRAFAGSVTAHGSLGFTFIVLINAIGRLPRPARLLRLRRRGSLPAVGYAKPALEAKTIEGRYSVAVVTAADTFRKTTRESIGRGNHRGRDALPQPPRQVLSGDQPERCDCQAYGPDLWRNRHWRRFDIARNTAKTFSGSVTLGRRKLALGRPNLSRFHQR